MMKAIGFLSTILLIVSGSLAAGGEELVSVPASTHKITDAASGKLTLSVYVSEFQIGRTEVTQKQYEAVVGENPSHYGGDSRPVENVSWWDGVRYCNLRSQQEGLEPCYDLETGTCDFTCTGYRLPTEWEWRVACAGADDKLDPSKANVGADDTRDGQELIQLAKEKGTQDVASYPPNTFGLHDMAGNVWEWCYDNFNELKNSPRPSLADPTGPATGLEKVIRGGSFVSVPYIYHSEHQGKRSLRPERRSRFTGFRICRGGETWGKRPSPTYGPDWFEPYGRVPEKFTGRGGLPSLLVGKDGKPIASVDQWEGRRAALKATWLQRLGVPPKPDEPPEVKVAGEFEGGCYSAKVIYLQWDPELFVKFVIMRPKRPLREPTPAVLVHGYDVDEAVGKNVGGHHQRDPGRMKAYGRMMTQQGVIAVAVAWWTLKDEGYVESMANLKLRWPECTGLGKTVWDTARVVDYLYTLPEVDKRNIGCTGHCMAGITTIYSAAFEERITTAVASGSNCSVFQSNYDDYWYLGKEALATIDKESDQQELLALIAPRPFLLTLGKGNYIDPCFAYVNTAREVYRLYGKPHYLGYFHDRRERPPSTAMVHRMRDWLVRFLSQPED